MPDLGQPGLELRGNSIFLCSVDLCIKQDDTSSSQAGLKVGNSVCVSLPGTWFVTVSFSSLFAVGESARQKE